MLGKISKGMGSYLYGAKKQTDIKPTAQETPSTTSDDNVMPLTADNLNKLQTNPYQA